MVIIIDRVVARLTVRRQSSRTDAFLKNPITGPLSLALFGRFSPFNVTLHQKALQGRIASSRHMAKENENASLNEGRYTLLGAEFIYNRLINFKFTARYC